MAKRQTYSKPPMAIPPLILVDTGNRCTIDGKNYRILAIERAKYTDVDYRVKTKTKKIIKAV